jgi:hypothetical protein
VASAVAKAHPPPQYVRYTNESFRGPAMPFDDLFKFFRWWLGWIVTIYATIITVQSLWGWYLWLAGADRYTSLLRRYLLVHGLRLRFKTFWGDVIICGLLCVAFGMIWRAQNHMDEIEHRIGQIKHTDHKTGVMRTTVSAKSQTRPA